MADLAVLFNQLTEARRVIESVRSETGYEWIANELRHALRSLDTARALLAGVSVDELDQLPEEGLVMATQSLQGALTCLPGYRVDCPERWCGAKRGELCHDLRRHYGSGGPTIKNPHPGRLSAERELRR
jgi:hypothetical protein